MFNYMLNTISPQSILKDKGFEHIKENQKSSISLKAYLSQEIPKTLKHTTNAKTNKLINKKKQSQRNL